MSKTRFSKGKLWSFGLILIAFFSISFKMDGILLNLRLTPEIKMKLYGNLSSRITILIHRLRVEKKVGLSK